MCWDIEKCKMDSWTTWTGYQYFVLCNTYIMYALNKLTLGGTPGGNLFWLLTVNTKKENT